MTPQQILMREVVDEAIHGDGHEIEVSRDDLYKLGEEILKAESRRLAIALSNLAVLTERAFKAGYHCQWIVNERRYIFNPYLKPGDPDGAYAAWKETLK